MEIPRSTIITYWYHRHPSISRRLPDLKLPSFARGARSNSISLSLLHWHARRMWHSTRLWGDGTQTRPGHSARYTSIYDQMEVEQIDKEVMQRNTDIMMHNTAKGPVSEVIEVSKEW